MSLDQYFSPKKKKGKRYRTQFYQTLKMKNKTIPKESLLMKWRSLIYETDVTSSNPSFLFPWDHKNHLYEFYRRT